MRVFRWAEPTQAIHRSVYPWEPINEAIAGLMRREPFAELAARLRRNEPRAAFSPAFDLLETREAFVFKADLPGVDENDLEISVCGNQLHVVGRREPDRLLEADTYHFAERGHGRFRRVFILPEPVGPEQIQASLRDGVLSVQVTKSAGPQPRKVSVRGAGERTETTA